MSIECNDKKTVCGTGRIFQCDVIQENIFRISVIIPEDSAHLPKPGQFYMLRAKPSSVYLTRPISVFHVITKDSCEKADAEEIKYLRSIDSSVMIKFLVMQKGNGTIDLCNLRESAFVDIIGPLGNGFPMPDEKALKEKRVAIIGGGIGVAPVAGFAETLPDMSYDFFASFRTGHYGVEYISPRDLAVSTNDGSMGIKGILPDIFTENLIQYYDYIYACGPVPMLKYIQKITEGKNVKCFLSMESKMACGVGACLGCTISTKSGNKRCCKDGPVFESSQIIF